MQILSGKLCILLLLFSFWGFFGMSLHAQQPASPDSSRPIKQRDLIDEFKRLFKVDQKEIDSSRAKKKFQFSLIPSAGAVAGGGVAVATAFNAAFFTGPETTTSLSTVTFSPWFSFDGKFVLPFRNMIWLPNDKLLSKGDTRFMIYPQYTWGLGGNTQQENKALLEYNYFRFYQSLLKKTSSRIYFGAGYYLDHHFNATVDNDSAARADIPFFDYAKEYRQTTTSSGPVVNFLIDSRHNSINPPRGMYFAVDYRFNPKFLGSTLDWQSLLVDFRKYFSFDKRRQNILALWSYFWGVTYGRAPYLDMPSIGWDYYNRSGRGFEQNRYRSNRLLYFESEYRRDISRNGFLGFVVFTNFHSVSEYETKDFVYWHPAGGAGLRIKFNKISKTNIGIDLGTSKNYTGIYLLLGEAF